MAPTEALARRLGVGLLGCALLIGCSGGGGAADEVTAAWAFEPGPPATGVDTNARITLHDADGQPLRGADLRLEGHMSHPGMAPVIADVIERGAGVYEARMQFSMAGDWVLMLTGELADGRRFAKQLEIAGVQPAP